MNHEAGDSYIRRTASFIRRNEQAIGESAPRRRRNAAPSSVKPITLDMDIHRLYYLLIRIESIGINVGSMDVKVVNPSKPLHHIQIFKSSDSSDSISIASSMRSSLSAISTLSMSSWFRPSPPSIDVDIKYLFSSFTKLPALRLGPATNKSIIEMERDTPNENSVPLDSFKNLQVLFLTGIDPRGIVGWDRLSGSLIRLEIRDGGVDDPLTDVMVRRVHQDQLRREQVYRNPEPRKISKSTTFRGTKLPETVTEDEDEDDPEVNTADSAHPSLLPDLPSSRWAFLRHLSLADNVITSIPIEPLKYLQSLVSLDLSSNLLVSIPPGLDTLPCLSILNLSDNMIDSILRISTQLGQIHSLNLSKNRLDSVCGLERVLALTSVDLSYNALVDVDEIGRLAPLPHIVQVGIVGNPFSIANDRDYRIAAFTHFWKAGNREIAIDGSVPGFYENRVLTDLLGNAPSNEQMKSIRTKEIKANSPPAIPVRNAPESSKSKSPLALQSELPAPNKDDKPSVNLGIIPELPDERPPAEVVVKRKAKRIVEFNPEGVFNDTASTKSAIKHKARRRNIPAIKESVSTPAGGNASESARHKYSHSRSISQDDTLSPLQVTNLSNSAKRRARVSASMFEPSTKVTEESNNNAEAFRRQIEALQSDVGDGWLKVFNQAQAEASVS